MGGEGEYGDGEGGHVDGGDGVQVARVVGGWRWGASGLKGG